ncbi:hypothetical protein NHP190003_03450 [Helicobacter sp. NHP19-003]|uniref:Uncharacterized protein n=1 Tax=Helicobacter gastrocanis TaxID=2849641 RepID=A0ABM7S969_9HELI|nr:hypothetical protein NHP190003_03450 [Helicobacter sp. NHP19-003]
MIGLLIQTPSTRLGVVQAMVIYPLVVRQPLASESITKDNRLKVWVRMICIAHYMKAPIQYKTKATTMQPFVH